MAKKKVKSSRDVLSITSIIMGVVSIIFAFFIPYLVGITGILGAVFAYVKKGKNSKKLNLWGFVLNMIGLFLAIIMLTISLLAVMMQNLSGIVT